MRNLIFLIALVAIAGASESSEKQELRLPIQDYLDLVQGFLEGASVQVSLVDIVDCINSTNFEIGKVVAIVQGIAAGNISDIPAVFNDIGDIFTEIPHALKTCTDGRSDLLALRDLLASFNSTGAFAYNAARNLMVNGPQIYQDLQNAGYFWNSSEYHAAGNVVGHIVGTVLFLRSTVETTTTPRYTAALFEGMTGGARKEDTRDDQMED